MTNKTELKALLAKVEAGDVLAGDIAVAFNLHPTTAASLKGGSLDAAKALHEAVLPGWKLQRLQQFESGRWYVKLYQPRGEGWPKWTPYPEVSAVSDDTPARAWLIAILKALIAEGREGQ